MPDDPTNWKAACEALDLETLRLVALIVREVYEHEGRWPTATEIRAKLHRPGV